MAIPIRVLIIEDSESDADLIRYHLRKAGFDLTCARVETAEAVQAALENQSWDIVISDYNLPGFSGPAALRLLQEIRPEIPFIVASGTISEETAIDMMRAGAADYLMKDRLARLGTLVRRELNIAQVQRERKEARQALIDSELRFRTFFELSPYGVLIFDIETTLPIEFNTIAHQQLGYTREEFSRLRVIDYEIAESPAEVEKHIQEILAKGSDEFVTHHRTKQGETRIVQVTVQILELSGKKVSHVVHHDVTEIHQAHLALRLSEEKFSTAFHVSPDSININRLTDGLYIEINDGFKALTGYTDAEVVGKTSLEINIWDNPQDRARLVKELREKGVVLNFEATFRAKDGTTRVCLMSARMIEINGEKCILSITRDISDLKRAELAIRTSEQNFREIFNSTTEAIFIHDAETGQIIDVNERMLKMWGYECKDAVLGQNIGNLSKGISPYNEETAQQLMQRAILEGPQMFEWMSKRRDGSTFWSEVTLRRSQIGGKDRVLAVVRETTERKHAEEEILHSKEALDRQNGLLTSLLKNLPVGIFMVEVPSGRPLVANDAAYQILGRGILPDVTSENLGEVYEAYKASTRTRYPPQEMPIILGMQGKAVHVEDMLVVRPDQTEMLLEVIGTPVADQDGKIWASLVSFRDITERKRMESAVRESENKQKRMIANISDVIGILGVDGTVLYISPNLERWFGWLPEDLIGTDGWKTVHPDDLSRIRKEFAVLLQKENLHRTVQYRYLCKDGSYTWIELTAVNLTRDPLVNGILVNYHDITERMQIDQRLNEQLAELKRWYSLTLGREKRILELKGEVNELLKNGGLPARYASAEENPL